MDELSTLKRIKAMSSPFIDIAATSEPVVQPPSTETTPGRSGSTVRDRADRCITTTVAIFDEDLMGCSNRSKASEHLQNPANVHQRPVGGWPGLEMKGPKRNGAAPG